MITTLAVLTILLACVLLGVIRANSQGRAQPVPHEFVPFRGKPGGFILTKHQLSEAEKAELRAQWESGYWKAKP